jgi:adenylate cyclase class 2
MKDTEIEVKLKIYNLEKLKIRLGTNAHYVGKMGQIDIYFNPPHQDFITTLPDGKKVACNYLRIRKSDKGSSICYKHIPKDLDTGKATKQQFLELETKIDDVDTMIEIFHTLGFQETARIDKIRETYRYEDFTLELDSVRDL